MRLQRGHTAIAPTPEITNIRPVTRADLAHLTAKRDPTVLKSIGDNHHRVARAVASGMSTSEVAATCGLTISRVSTLKSDPSFADLVAHYRAIITTEWAQQDTVVEFLRSNSLKAQAMLSDKLDEAADKGEFLPTRDLLGIAELGLDRTGYGKERKNINVNLDFAAKLEAARNRSAARTIEARPLPPSPQPTVVQSSLPSPAPRSALRRI